MRGYSDDLAYIHDVAFSDYGRKAAPGLLRILKRSGIHRGRVIDLGCGSGRWARELNRNGYQVLGVDQSPAFIRLARQNAPHSKFVCASLWSAGLPECDAVTSIGECFNYGFDPRSGRRELARLFARVHKALRPGGLFIFDVADPGRVPERQPRRSASCGADWAILVETSGDAQRRMLTRRIVCFRKTGRRFRRTEETHRLHLYAADDIARILRRAGFHVRRLQGYGRFRLSAGIAVFLARK